VAHPRSGTLGRHGLPSALGCSRCVLQAPAAQPPDPPRDRGHGLQAEVLGLCAWLRLVGAEAALAVHNALPGLREDLPTGRDSSRMRPASACPRSSRASRCCASFRSRGS
jgi:hypothetical protein